MRCRRMQRKWILLTIAVVFILSVVGIYRQMASVTETTTSVHHHHKDQLGTLIRIKRPLPAVQVSTPVNRENYVELKHSELNYKVWPIPQRIRYDPTKNTRGYIAIDPHYDITTSFSSKILKEGIGRYKLTLDGLSMKSSSSCPGTPSLVKRIIINVLSADEELGLNTNYSYSVTVGVGSFVSITGQTVFGALYGLETVTQLFSENCVESLHLYIEDHPKYRHRGFMLDTGRRFVPKELILNILDAMSYVKMNVFHWHFADWCSYSIESKIHPPLTDCLGKEEKYSQEDAIEIVEYARKRGIRVIPEIDIPGHAKGMQTMKDEGLFFCDASLRQIYNDPPGKSLKILKDLILELTTLFPDDYFHIGCDETAVVGKCTTQNMKSLEEEVARYVIELGKVPVGWEEMLFSTGVKIPGMVVQGWSVHSATDIARHGYYGIESNINYYYLDYVDRTNWKIWNGPLDANRNESGLNRLILGGEFAIWGDMWIRNRQCWDEKNWQLLPRSPVAHFMHSVSMDTIFMESMANMIWPRGIAAAGRFWNKVDGLDQPALQRILDHQTQFMVDRGIKSCPTKCSCNYLKKCETLYPRSPSVGSTS